MKKWLIIFIISALIVLSGGWLTSNFLQNDTHSPNNKAKQTSTAANGELDRNAYKETTSLTAESSQSEVIDVMHKMTHQKVKASEKWGSVHMSEQAIKEVKTTIENNQFEHEEELLAIIEKWSIGDFSAVDDDHNYFWALQNGTIGKAMGILSAEEEKAFIEKYFE